MVHCQPLKSRYTRCLLKYHLFIFVVSWMLSSMSIGLIISREKQIHWGNLFQGFQVHGTKSSDDYRKYLALLRETQLAHLFPHSMHSKTFQQLPYASYQPHVNPCTKRFYRKTCPIISYVELTLDVNSSILFDNLRSFQSICRLEWNLKKNFTNCSTIFCCEYIGAVDLLFNGQLSSSEQCDNLTDNHLEEFHSQWLSCNSSSFCSNDFLHHYLTYLPSFSSNLKIYLHRDNSSSRLFDFYIYLSSNRKKWNLIEMNLPLEDEESLFVHLVINDIHSIILTGILYLISLIFFVKNLLFLLTILQQIFLTMICTWMIYHSFCQFPLVILNATSLIFYLVWILLDSALWYTCWDVNHHRRNDCPIERIIESLSIQIFYYILPKTLTAMIALIITYSNQIIALQYSTFFAFLLLIISFLISFILYPVTFIIILRYQSMIPNIEHCLDRCLTNALTNCLMDRTIPYLIVRFKAFWLTLFTILAGLSILVIYHWPRLQFDVCHLTFDTFPPFSSTSIIPKRNLLDIDVTYYIGSHWEVPNESFIPLKDIPILDYNWENRMTAKPGDINTFEYALERNLSKLIQFCTQLKRFDEQSILEMKKIHYRHLTSSIVLNNPSITLTNPHCFGDSIPQSLSDSSSTNKFSSIIRNHSDPCSIDLCQSNSYDCILCHNALYYQSMMDNDLAVLKNGLRFMNDVQYPRYLFQTINYQWKISSDWNDFSQWKIFMEYLRTNPFQQFYSQIFPRMSIWWSSEISSTYTILEQLQQEKSLLIAIQFLLILIFLVIFTGILGIFVTLTTLFNFLTCMAIFTWLDWKLTIENLSYFIIIFIISSQYSVLYSISYKFAPTFFFQRENRTIYSLKQLCTTLLHFTLSILLIGLPCLFSSLPYLYKTAMVYMISSVMSFIYSTFFLQSLLCYLGPADQTCSFLSCPMKFTGHSAMQNNNQEIPLRKYSNNSRRHQRRSTSSYFSQIFTGSTYFESEYGGISETSMMSSRRRESSRSYQSSHIIKRHSILTGEVIELYTPRASLAPHGHHFHYRYHRHSSVPRTTPIRPLYISPSISPHSQSSLHSPVVTRQHSVSPQLNITPVLRPCFSAPRLQIPLPRITKKSLITIQRQDGISTIQNTRRISAATKRHILKGTINQSRGPILWLKRSNSS